MAAVVSGMSERDVHRLCAALADASSLQQACGAAGLIVRNARPRTAALVTHVLSAGPTPSIATSALRAGSNVLRLLAERADDGAVGLPGAHADLLHCVASMLCIVMGWCRGPGAGQERTAESSALLRQLSRSLREQSVVQSVVLVCAASAAALRRLDGDGGGGRGGSSSSPPLQPVANMLRLCECLVRHVALACCREEADEPGSTQYWVDGAVELVRSAADLAVLAQCRLPATSSSAAAAAAGEDESVGRAVVVLSGDVAWQLICMFSEVVDAAGQRALLLRLCGGRCRAESVLRMLLLHLAVCLQALGHAPAAAAEELLVATGAGFGPPTALTDGSGAAAWVAQFSSRTGPEVSPSEHLISTLGVVAIVLCQTDSILSAPRKQQGPTLGALLGVVGVVLLWAFRFGGLTRELLVERAAALLSAVRSVVYRCYFSLDDYDYKGNESDDDGYGDDDDDDDDDDGVPWSSRVVARVERAKPHALLAALAVAQLPGAAASMGGTPALRALVDALVLLSPRQLVGELGTLGDDVARVLDPCVRAGFAPHPRHRSDHKTLSYALKFCKRLAEAKGSARAAGDDPLRALLASLAKALAAAWRAGPGLARNTRAPDDDSSISSLQALEGAELLLTATQPPAAAEPMRLALLRRDGADVPWSVLLARALVASAAALGALAPGDRDSDERWRLISLCTGTGRLQEAVATCALELREAALAAAAAAGGRREQPQQGQQPPRELLAAARGWGAEEQARLQQRAADAAGLAAELGAALAAVHQRPGGGRLKGGAAHSLDDLIDGGFWQDNHPPALREAVDLLGPADALGARLLVLGERLSGLLPTPLACNNARCERLAARSEAELVGGRATLCGGCQRARFCSLECQRAAWPQHRATCMRLAAARKAAAEAGAAAEASA